MRSAISTAIIGTRPLRPRWLQLYPSIGKHFQTTPVPVHFDGNKMKMQTTYASQVLFCTKSSGGLSKQQDYSNTNTAVSLPPTQETPKMILTRILVSIVSSAALLLYSSLFISHCFAKPMPSVQRNIDNCSVCEAVAEQLFEEVKRKWPFVKDSEQHDDDLVYNNIIATVEKVFTHDDWIRKIRIEDENLNTERQVCDLGCPKTIFNKVMGNVKIYVIADFVYKYKQWSDGERESLKAYLCENLTESCRTGLDKPKKGKRKRVEELEEKKNEKNVTFLKKLRTKLDELRGRS